MKRRSGEDQRMVARRSSEGCGLFEDSMMVAIGGRPVSCFCIAFCTADALDRVVRME